MKKIEKLLKTIEKKIKKTWRDLRKDPKRTILNFFNRALEIVKHNVLFFVFIISLLFNTILLRYFTIHTWENVFFLKPLLADLSIILIVGGLGFFIKQRSRFAYFMTASLIMTIICIINSVYYTFYTSFASISLLSTSRYVVAVGDAVIENVIRIQDLIYIWSPIALLAVHIRLKKTGGYYKENHYRRCKKKALTVLLGALISGLFVLSSLTPTEASRFAKQWNREYLVMTFGIYTYHLNDLVKSIEPQLTTLFGYDNAMKTFREYYQDTPDTNEKTNKYTNIFKGKNLLSIHLESMQNFVIGLTFNGQEVTPNLNKLVKKSIYFNNFYSQVSVGTSSDSEFTLNTSLMPTNTGTAFVSYFDRTYVSIPNLLKEQGYYAFSMHGNNGSYWNRDIMHKSLGYDHFYSKSEYEIDDVIGLGLSDKSFFKQSVEKIKTINEKGKPYYGSLLMLTNHTPFSDTEKYGEFDVDIKETITNAEGQQEEVVHPYMEGTKLGNYFKAVHYADAALGEFLQSLEDEGLMENTVLMLYGDHDARLPKSDYVKLYNYDKETDSVLSSDDPNYKEVDYYQYELLRKVPYIIYSKETEKKLHKEVSTVMGMYDIMPTIGNMFGFYNKYQLGKDIFNTDDDNIVVFPNGNWLTNKVYYNSQSSEYLTLKDNTVITDEYIKECDEYTEKLLSVSNSLIVFDLIRKEKETEESDSDYIEERTTEQ